MITLFCILRNSWRESGLWPRALTYYRRGRYELAVRALEELGSDNPAGPRSTMDTMLLALSYHKLDRKADSLRLLDASYQAFLREGASRARVHDFVLDNLDWYSGLLDLNGNSTHAAEIRENLRAYRERHRVHDSRLRVRLSLPRQVEIGVGVVAVLALALMLWRGSVRRF